MAQRNKITVKKQVQSVVAELSKMPIGASVDKKTTDSLRDIYFKKVLVWEKTQKEYLANVSRIKKQNAELRSQNLELRKYITRSFLAAKMETPENFGNGTEEEYTVTSLKGLEPIPKTIHDTIYIYRGFMESIFKHKKK